MSKPLSKDIPAVEAEHGEKMIEVRLRFWTNDIADEPGKVIPKHAWTSGMVHVTPNETHGIGPDDPKPFQSLLDIGAVIEKMMIEHGIVLHHSRQMEKYIAARPPKG